MNELSGAFGAVAGVFALAVALSLVNERVMEFVIRPFVEAFLRSAGRPLELTGRILPYLAAVSGALISLGFKMDLFAPLAAAVGLEPEVWVTRVLTAVVVAGGSNFLHDTWPGGKGAG